MMISILTIDIDHSTIGTDGIVGIDSIRGIVQVHSMDSTLGIVGSILGIVGILHMDSILGIVDLTLGIVDLAVVSLELDSVVVMHVLHLHLGEQVTPTIL